MSGWIMTFTGRAFDPFEPRIEDVCITDIAHQLAAIARFTGACRRPYSVAQHSILVSIECPEGEAQLYGLLHDAAEAYLGDIPRPLKHRPEFDAYRAAEDRLQAVIYQAFGLDAAREPADVKAADRRMLRTEQRDLMPPPRPDENRADVPPYERRIRPASFSVAKFGFLCRFADLTGTPRPSVGEVC